MLRSSVIIGDNGNCGNTSAVGRINSAICGSCASISGRSWFSLGVHWVTNSPTKCATDRHALWNWRDGGTNLIVLCPKTSFHQNHQNLVWHIYIIRIWLVIMVVYGLYAMYIYTFRCFFFLAKAGLRLETSLDFAAAWPWGRPVAPWWLRQDQQSHHPPGAERWSAGDVLYVAVYHGIYIIYNVHIHI